MSGAIDNCEKAGQTMTASEVMAYHTNRQVSLPWKRSASRKRRKITHICPGFQSNIDSTSLYAYVKSSPGPFQPQQLGFSQVPFHPDFLCSGRVKRTFNNDHIL